MQYEKPHVKPHRIAMGIVIAIVKKPQGECAKAFTTTIAKIAMIMSMIPKIPRLAIMPTN